MSTEIKLFENNEVRFVTEDNGNFWIVGKDLLKALEYPESSFRQLNNVFRNIPDEWKGHKPIMTPGGTQLLLCLSEQGLYFFLGRSDKPKAIPYQRWIAGEVVPSIRRTGSYSINQDSQVKLALDELNRKFDQLAIDVQEMKPKAIFYDAVTETEQLYSIGRVAKILKDDGHPIGRNRLFKILREQNILMTNREPYQRYVNNGMFKMVLSKKNLYAKTVATGKGLQYIKTLIDSLT